MRKKLFLSYSRKDKSVAKRVADALEIHDFDVFWEAEIPPGQKFDSYIFSQLQQSDAVIVLWSVNSVKSDYVKEEAEYAKTHCVLVPLRIDETTLPFGFARIHTTDIIDWQGSIQDPEWRRVVDAIESSLQDREGIRHDETEPEEVGDDLEASRRSIPVETAKPKRTHVSASAILAIGHRHVNAPAHLRFCSAIGVSTRCSSLRSCWSRAEALAQGHGEHRVGYRDDCL